MFSSVFHEGYVVDSNHLGEKDPFGDPWGVNYVYIRMPWRASVRNPDPVSNHPVPVYVNRHHTEGRKSWDILPPGTRVLVVDTDKQRGINEMGMAVVGYGPAVTDVYDDVRQTSHYTTFPDGSSAKLVDDQDDPVAGPNEDVGLSVAGPEGEGVTTRRPWESDPLRRESNVTWPGAKFMVSQEDRLDGSSIFLALMAALSGAKLHMEQTTSPEDYHVELGDGQGQSLLMKARPTGQARFTISIAPTGTPGQFLLDFDPLLGELLMDVTGGAQAIQIGPSALALLLGGGAAMVDIAGGGQPVARMGDTVAVSGTTSTGTPFTGTGTITSGSTKVTSG